MNTDSSTETARKGVFWNKVDNAYKVTLGRIYLGTFPKDCLDLANQCRAEAEQLPSSKLLSLKDKYTQLKRKRGVVPGTRKRKSGAQEQEADPDQNPGPDIDEDESSADSSGELAIARQGQSADEQRRKLEYSIGLQVLDADPNISMLPFLIEQALSAEEQAAAIGRQLLDARAESGRRWDAVSRALLSIKSPALRESLLAILDSEGAS